MPFTPMCICCGRYENTEARAAKLQSQGLMYMGMGVSGGEEGARNGTPCCTVCSAGQPMLCRHARWDAMMSWLLPLQLPTSNPQHKQSP